MECPQWAETGRRKRGRGEPEAEYVDNQNTVGDRAHARPPTRVHARCGSVGARTTTALAFAVALSRAADADCPASASRTLSSANVPALTTTRVTTKMASMCLWMFMMFPFR